LSLFKDFEFEFMTFHRSKGLGYDNVIIINAIDATYGFPSKIQDDPVLKFDAPSDTWLGNQYCPKRFCKK